MKKCVLPQFNTLNTELNPICRLLALLGAHHILHVSRIRVNILNGRRGVTLKAALMPKKMRLICLDTTEYLSYYSE